jgi:carbon monoxide dehydrogenase subunit G
MEMTGERQIAASRDVVWAALNNPDVLKQCIPGCESLEMLSPTDMTARVKLQIGPVKANFAGKVKLSDLDPPNGYRISGEGSGGVAGHAKGGATVRLMEDNAGTLMRYEVKADVGGKLAQLGGRLIDATAKRLADEFFEKFSAVVGGPAAQQSAPPPPSPPKKEGWFRRLFRKKKQAASPT